MGSRPDQDGLRCGRRVMGGGQCCQAGVDLLRRATSASTKSTRRKKTDRNAWNLAVESRRMPSIGRSVRTTSSERRRAASAPRRPRPGSLGREAVDDVVADVGDEYLGAGRPASTPAAARFRIGGWPAVAGDEGAVGFDRAPVAEAATTWTFGPQAVRVVATTVRNPRVRLLAPIATTRPTLVTGRA